MRFLRRRILCRRIAVFYGFVKYRPVLRIAIDYRAAGP